MKPGAAQHDSWPDGHPGTGASTFDRLFGEAVPLILLRWAQSHPAVRRFRASVSADNLPSRNLVTALGFIEVGSQWDEEDGEELVFEQAAGQA